MEFFRVSVEGHRHSLTVYVAGLLCERARVELERIVTGASATTRALRVDLRAVHVIDPAAFTHVARSLAAWRDRSGGRITIEFPERTRREEESNEARMARPALRDARHRDFAAVVSARNTSAVI